MKISTFILLSFLSIPVSAQLTLNGTPLLSSPGTYSEAIVLPPDAVLSVSGSGDYTLSGVISDRIIQHPTLLQMHSGTGTDYSGGLAEVTSSGALNRDFRGWKCINNSTYGEWISRWANGELWLQVKYGVPVIITSAELRSRPNSSGTITHWRIEGSADGTAWSTLYSNANGLPGHTITTVAWRNTTAYTYYRFYGFASNAPDTNFNPMNINYFYDRNQGLIRFQLLGDRAPTPTHLTVQAGSGNIILTGANTYSGTTTISTGTLQTGNGGITGTLGTGAITIANQASLTIHRSDAITLSNTISGSGTLIQQGTGTTLLTAANTYTGGTTLNGGLLKAGHLTALGTGQAAINSGAALDIRGFSAITHTHTLTNNGGTLLRDDGLYLNGRWLTSHTHTPYSADIVLTRHSTLTQTGPGTYTISGVISGQYGITTDTGAGNTLLLTGANTYSGPTTISTGTLQTGDGGPTGTLGNGAITIAGQAALTINRSNEITLSNTISGSGTLIQQGPGTTRLTAANTYTGGTTLNGGLLKSGHLSALSTGAITLNSATLDLRGGFSTLTNALTNNGGTLLRDDGLYLNNALLTTNAGTPYSADIIVTKNSTLIQAGAGTYTLSGVISGEYEITSDIGAGNTLLLTGANTYGTTFIRSGTLQTGNGGPTGTLGTGAITIANQAALKINRSNELPLSNTISGSGTLIQQGLGTTRLTGANTYTGGSTLNGGTLKAGSLLSFGTGTIAVNTGAVLDLTGGLGNIANTVNNSGGTLLRNNGLFLNGQWLTSNTTAPYSADIVLTQHSVLTQLAAGTYTISGVISGGYGLTSDTGSGNTLLLTGANTYSGPTTITSGTLQTGHGETGTLGTGAITIAEQAALTINRTNEITLSNTISGSGSLTQQGSGKTILSAANTYTGATTVLSGELSISGTLTSPVTIKSGALLSSGVTGTLENTVLIESGGALQAGNSAVGTLTINGLLTLQNNAVLNVYSSHAEVSKIITSSPPIAGTLTVNLKTPMTAGSYPLLQTSGSVTATVTPGENSTTLYCISYSWGTEGLQLTANNNTTIIDAQVSGGGKITNATSTGLSVLLSSSQTGVTYTLYRTIHNTSSSSATMAGTGQPLTFGGGRRGLYYKRHPGQLHKTNDRHSDYYHRWHSDKRPLGPKPYSRSSKSKPYGRCA